MVQVVRFRWSTSILAAIALCTIFLVLSASGGRFQVSTLATQVKVNIKTSGQRISTPKANDSVSSHEPLNPAAMSAQSFKRPRQKIVAMVFAGRQEYVSILDCYLQRNLVRNGGLLDEVMWIMHVNRTTDLVYLHDLTDRIPEYTKHEIYSEEEDDLKPFSDAYKLCQPDTYYIKLDDDIVFIEDNAIQSVIQRKIEHPDYLIVSANVLNQPALTNIHAHLNTTKPYLPELHKPADFVDDDRRYMVDWRPSKLPAWDGPKYHNFSITSPAPFKGHRWLPVRNGDIRQTPLGSMNQKKIYEDARNSTGYASWAIAAQLHSSFLEHLEHDDLARYKFDYRSYHNESHSTSFIAFSGDDTKLNPVRGEDDIWWTAKLPSKLGRPAVIDGRGLVVHFGTQAQTRTQRGAPGQGLRDTDLLLRYMSYANEFICGKPWGSRIL